MGPSPNRASMYARKGGEGGGYPLPQVNQFLFEIDIPLLLGVSTLPPPPRPYAGRRMGGARPRGSKTVKFKKKLKEWVG